MMLSAETERIPSLEGRRGWGAVAERLFGCLPLAARSLAARAVASPLARRLARGAAWSAAGAVASRGLGLAAAVLMARMLGQTVFGELAMIQNTIAMLSAFAGLGLGMTATKFIAEHRSRERQKTGRIVALALTVIALSSLVFGALLAAGAHWLAASALGMPALAGLVRIGALLLVLSAINGVQVSILAGFESFRSVARINAICGLINFPLILLGADRLGGAGVLWAWIATAGTNVVLSQAAIRRECSRAGVPPGFRGCWAERGLVMPFSLPVVIGTLLSTVVDWVMLTMLVQQAGGYAEAGVFNAARQWSMLILYLPNMVANTTLPVLSNLLGEGRHRQFRRVLLINCAVFAGFALVLAVPVALLARPIMDAYGADFSGGRGTFALVLMCVYSVLFASHIVIGQALWAMGSVREAVWFAVVRAAIMMAGWYLFRGLGAAGLALTYAATYVIQTLYLIPYVRLRAAALAAPRTA